MPSLAITGPLSSLFASPYALAKRFLTLATVESKQASLRELFMLVCAVQAAGQAITSRLGPLAGIASGRVALGITALLSLAGASGLETRTQASDALTFAPQPNGGVRATAEERHGA